MVEDNAGRTGSTEASETARMERFYHAYTFLQNHPIFDRFRGEVTTKKHVAEFWKGVGLRSGWDPSDIKEDLGMIDEGPDIITAPPNPAFDKSLLIEVVRTNPKTGKIDKNPARNTKVQVWLETGPWEQDLYEGMDLPGIPKEMRGGFTLDPDLSSSGDTFEGAIIKLAKKVRSKYGSYQLPQD